MADYDAILLHDDHVAVHLSTTDYFFDRIGDPVPIKPSPFNFDPQNPPSQPLAVSERHGLIFVALSSGFCVARTKDVIVLANEIKERRSTSSVLESSFVNVQLGEVRILALSFDNSTLAASVGRVVHFFSVLSLREQQLNSSFSRPLNESSYVKDIRWRTKSDNSFLVLSELGKLYHGKVDGSFENVMDNVDAVEWSIEGDYIVVAQENNLSILSPEFEERSRIVLSFTLWIGDSDANRTVKVDSIRWVRRDSIIVGCFQLTEDGKEENYLVQVIRSNDGNFADGPIAISFHDLFSSVIDDILPFGSGPYLLSSYLEQWELAFIANKKNTDQYIKYLRWSNGEVSGIDIERDTHLPRIFLQENDDDNLILGMCTYKVPLRLAHASLGWRGLASSRCILMCLTVEGKLVMFNFRQSDDALVVVLMMKLKQKLNYLVTTATAAELAAEVGAQAAAVVVAGAVLAVAEGEIKLKSDYVVMVMSMVMAMVMMVMVELGPKLYYLVAAAAAKAAAAVAAKAAETLVVAAAATGEIKLKLAFVVMVTVMMVMVTVMMVMVVVVVVMVMVELRPKLYYLLVAAAAATWMMRMMVYLEN